MSADRTRPEVWQGLDAQIAEHVMGLCWHKWSTTWDEGWTAVCLKCKDERSGGGNMLSPRDGLRFAPSTDIRDAWQVVEKVLYQRGWYLAPMPDTNGWWGVFEGDNWYEVAIADTAPLAICRAALRAVGTPGRDP